MEVNNHSSSAIVNARNGGFSLLKGLLLLGAAMLVGFVLTYELISISGDDYHGIDDVIQNSALKLSHIANRDVDQESSDSPSTSSVPGMTSSGHSTAASTTSGGHPQTTTGQQTTFTTPEQEMVTNVTENVTLADPDFNLTGNGTNSTDLVFATTTSLPTTTPKPCFREGYKIKQACDIEPYVNETYGENVTLEMVGHMLFKTEILDLLLERCDPGDWCLEDDWLIVSDDNDYLDFCYLGTCLRDNMSDECMDEERRVIMSTLLLLCDDAAATYNISDADQCYIALRKMTHVTMSMVTRRPHVEQTCDAIGQSDAANCTDTCQEFAKGLYCMCEICDHQKELYQEYSDWQWFFKNDEAIVECHLSNETTCYYLMSPTESWFNDFWNRLKTVDVPDMTDARVLTGVIIAGVVMVTGLAVSVWACVRKGSVFKRYGRDRIEYTQVGEEEDEFDDTA